MTVSPKSYVLSVTMEKKMGVICIMDRSRTLPNVCRSVKLPPSAVSALMKSADEIQLSGHMQQQGQRK